MNIAPNALPIYAGRVRPKGVSLVSLNTHGLRSNLPEIKQFVRNQEIDLLLIQETHLRPHIRGLSIPNYSLIRDDRANDLRGGGTAIYYKKVLHCSPIPTPPLTNLEATVCKLGMTGHPSLVIASVYNPCKPILRSDIEAILSLGDSVVLFGDFNSKHTDWKCHSTNKNGRTLLQLTEHLNLDIILPSSPTYYPDNVANRPDILDFALTKGVALHLRAIDVHNDLGSDHRPVSLVLGAPAHTTPATKTFTNWEGYKKSLINKFEDPNSPLAVEADHFDSTAKIDDSVNTLTQTIQSALHDNERVVKVPNQKLPLAVKNLIQRKNAALRRAALYPTPAYRRRANALQRQVRARLSDERNSNWDSLMSDITPSHTAFYKVAKSLRVDTKANTPPITRPDGSIAFEDEEKADCFADSIAAQCAPSIQQFVPQHVSTVEDEVRHLNSLPITADPILTNSEEVKSIIKGLKPRKAPGADGISNVALKHLPEQVITLLVLIFNACFDKCHFPTAWKEAIVIGIPKPGKPLNIPSNHRPISLLKALGKVLERVIQSRMRRILLPTDGPPLIIPQQFGFRSRHSCPQQVHRIVEYILSGFYPKRSKTVAVFFDVAKAFDKVWHGGLIYKLHYIGLPDRLVRMLGSYLSDRTFRFRHERTLSSPRPITAGVPQGSVLAPLLFISYTNDIPIPQNGVQLSLFADDTALYFKSPRLDLAISKVQHSVSELEDWFKKWRIEVNPDKSSAVCFHYKRRRGLDDPPIRFSGTPVPWTSQTKYLGVTLDSRLTFQPHITKVTRAARFYMGRLNCMLGRNSKMSLRNKRTLYKVCIRPVLLYAAPVFAHAAPRIMQKIQIIQNLFLRRATNAHWCVRNADLHRDLELPTIQQVIRDFSERFFKSLEEHPNPLAREAADYTAPPLSRYQIRRPRNALLDPPNQLSADLECLLAARSQQN